ncbi:MAG: hypothetical protein LRY43_03130 [Gammaproteobacteria bacterium]|nr:hypothetical protein [Gammaproteobacteria bacterium]
MIIARLSLYNESCKEFFKDNEVTYKLVKKSMLNIDIDRTYTSFCLAILTESDQMYLNQIFKKVDLSDILIAARRTKNNPVGVHRVSSQAAEILSNFIMALEVLQITYILDALFMSDHNRIIHANSLVDAITYKQFRCNKKKLLSAVLQEY